MCAKISYIFLCTNYMILGFVKTILIFFLQCTSIVKYSNTIVCNFESYPSVNSHPSYKYVQNEINSRFNKQLFATIFARISPFPVKPFVARCIYIH